MADKTIKVPENAPGKWYVDDTCVPCQTCLTEAPTLLKWNDDETKVYFVKQPANAEEEKAAESARDVCPTASIGDDGE